MLLIKRASYLLEGNKYALAGGYLDRDENISQGVLREILEETGYECEIEQLFRINSDPNRKGEDRQNVDFTLVLKPLNQKGKPDKEVQEIKWFDFDNLPENISQTTSEPIQEYLKSLE